MSFKAKLSHKIVLFWLLSIGLAMALTGTVFISLVQDIRNDDRSEIIANGFNFISSELYRTKNETLSSTEVINSRRSFIGSINLISSYQDISNYNHLIFDVEKEKLLNQMTRHAVSADLDLISVFDNKSSLVAFYYRNDKRIIDSGFVSYRNGAPLITNDASLEGITRSLESIPFFVTDITSANQKKRYVDHKSMTANGLLLSVNAQISKSSNDGKKNTIGFIKTGRFLGKDFASSISSNTGFNFGLILPSNVSYGLFDGSFLNVNATKLPDLIDGLSNSAVNTYVQKGYAVSARSLTLDDGSTAALLLGERTEDLTSEIEAFRNSSFLALGLLSILIVPLGILIIGRYISHPIDNIIDGFSSLGKGEYVTLAEASGLSEMKDLVSSFNATSDKLVQREMEINRLSTGIERSPVVVMITDTKGNIEYVNRKFESLTGYTAKEVTGKSPRFLKSGRMTKQEYKVMWDTITSGKIWHGEVLNCKNDGGLFWLLTSITPILDKDGKIESFLQIGEDITDRKHAEHEIKQFKSAVDYAIDSVFMFDTKTLKFSYVNNSAADHLGYSNNKLLEMFPFDINPDYDESSFRKLIKPLINAEVDNIRFETTHQHKDGHFVPVDISLQLVKLPQRTEKFMAFVRDISARRKAENELLHAYDDLEKRISERTKELNRSNEELKHFAYASSHDLQEPLRKIQSFSERLSERYSDELDEKGRHYINRLVNSATRMRHLIDDLLNYSRVTTKTKPFVRTDMDDLIKGVLDDLETSVEQAGATINLGHLHSVDADPTQMRQLLQNIISNALKFQRADESLTVDISSSIGKHKIGGFNGNEYCKIIIRDNGIGFEQKFANRIFGVFERLHGRGEYPGTGIGLATCKKIVERHGGTINADGTPGSGSCFTVVLPINQTQGTLQ